MRKSKSKETKAFHLGVRLTPDYRQKLLSRQEENGDESMSQTARKILCRGLDESK